MLGTSFLLLTSVFVLEVAHYVTTGTWVVVAGRGAFERWPVARQLYRDIEFHSLGMLVWMGVVVHQLWTRGAGLHRWVGRAGAGLMLGALAYAWRPALRSDIPALHGALGLTMQDLTLAVAGIGIVEELAIGLYEVRKGNIEAHRKHLLCAVMFTAAPAVYRVLVLALTSSLGLTGPEAHVWTSVWVHEVSQCGVLLLAMASLLSPWLGAHLDVVRGVGRRDYDRVERVTAWAMLTLITTMIAVYSLWTIDLLGAWAGDQPLLRRADLPMFVLHLGRS